MAERQDRIAALERLVANYEKSLADFSSIHRELQSLPTSPTLKEILALNESTIATTGRLLDTARERLDRERQDSTAVA